MVAADPNLIRMRTYNVYYVWDVVVYKPIPIMDQRKFNLQKFYLRLFIG